MSVASPQDVLLQACYVVKCSLQKLILTLLSSTATLAVQVQSLPKYTPNSLTRAVKSEAVPYTELANRYTGKTSTPDLAAIVAKHQAEFHAVRYRTSSASGTSAP